MNCFLAVWCDGRTVKIADELRAKPQSMSEDEIRVSNYSMYFHCLSSSLPSHACILTLPLTFILSIRPLHSPALYSQFHSINLCRSSLFLLLSNFSYPTCM